MFLHLSAGRPTELLRIVQRFDVARLQFYHFDWSVTAKLVFLLLIKVVVSYI